MQLGRKGGTERAAAKQGYREAKSGFRREIRKAEAKAWEELIMELEKDPWGCPYKIVLNRLRRATPTATELMMDEDLENVLDDCFPLKRKCEEIWKMFHLHGKIHGRLQKTRCIEALKVRKAEIQLRALMDCVKRSGV